MEAVPEIRELTEEEIMAVSGGVLPLVAIGVGLAKGFAWGVGAAMTVEASIQMYDFFTG